MHEHTEDLKLLYMARTQSGKMLNSTKGQQYDNFPGGFLS